MNYVGTEHLYTFFSNYPSIVYKKGDLIIQPDVTPTGIFYLKNGHVRLFLRSDDLTQFTTLIYKPGDVFSLRWALNNIDNIYYYEAINDAELLCSPRKDFITHLEKDALFSREIMSQLSYDFGAVIYRLQHLVFGDPYAKVASILLTGAKRFGTENGNKIEIPFSLSLQEISVFTGVNKRSVSTQLKKMENEKIIQYIDNKFIVLNVSELQEIAYV